MVIKQRRLSLALIPAWMRWMPLWYNRVWITPVKKDAQGYSNISNDSWNYLNLTKFCFSTATFSSHELLRNFTQRAVVPLLSPHKKSLLYASWSGYKVETKLCNKSIYHIVVWWTGPITEPQKCVARIDGQDPNPHRRCQGTKCHNGKCIQNHFLWIRHIN